MSNEAVITKIHSIEPHPNGDRIEIARVFGDLGFCSVIGKNTWKAGDLCLWIEPDSVLSDEIDKWLAENSKISIKNKRLRATKIRGVISEGLILRPEDFLPDNKIVEGFDASGLLGITHYSPPGPSWNCGRKRSKNMFYDNPLFLKYFHIDRFQKHPNVIEIGEPVITTCKRHGQNIRFYLGPKSEKVRKSLWFKIKKLLKITTDQEFLVGSHNTIRNPKYTSKDLESDHFLVAAEKYKMKELMPEIRDFLGGVCGQNNPLIVYGEVIGYGPTGGPLQIGYNYGFEKGDTGLVIYDICANGQFLDWSYVDAVCKKFNLPIVETIYKGPFNKEVLNLAEAVDEYNGQKYNREGIVIKPLAMRKDPRIGWVELKQISKLFLLDKSNSGYH